MWGVLFAPENTANRQALYDATGIELPQDLKHTNYNLLALNSKNKNILDLYLNKKTSNPDTLTLPDYLKQVENSNVKDIYLEHENTLKQPDSLTWNGEDGIIENNNTLLSQTEYTYVKKETRWSDDVVNHIRTMEEATVYINAGLKEVQVGNNKALVRNDIDLDQVNSEGQTNRELMREGLAPFAKNGEKIELHHIGQKNDSPLAELVYSQHRKKGEYKKLHQTGKASEIDRNSFDTTRKDYWKERLKQIELEGNFQ